jgi:2-polyprenyl-3-methyl-5-hydroxy-6-metoxy-1,4-benzoquinol methylase
LQTAVEIVDLNFQPVASLHDVFGEPEWERLEKDARGRRLPIGIVNCCAILLGPGLQVLDVACGAGRFDFECLSPGAEVALFDLSRRNLS